MADYNDTQKEILLTMLENNLELIFTYYDEETKNTKEYELMFFIDSSIDFITTEGVVLDYDSIGDLQLIVMYASWLYDKRKDGVAIMPRMLRYNLNNRLFSQKVYQGDC